MDATQQPISYAEFGHNFIRYVVTAERIRGEIETMLKSMIEGSVSKFPADLLVASYAFQLRDVDVMPIAANLPNVSFLMTLTGDMRLHVRFAGLKFRFALGVRIALHLDVLTYAPLTIHLVIHPVADRDVKTHVDAHDLPSEVLEQLRIVGPIVKDEIVREVNARIAGPDLATATRIDVLKIAAAAQLTPYDGDFVAPLAAIQGGPDLFEDGGTTG